MNFSIAVVSKNRSYTKSFKRVMVDLQRLIDALGNVEMKCQIGDSVLVMASDEGDLKPFEIVEIQNKDALFQYAAGIKGYVSDNELKMDLFLTLRLIVKKSPLPPQTMSNMKVFFKQWSRNLFCHEKSGVMPMIG